MYKTTLYIPVGISGQGKTRYGNKIRLNDSSVKMVSPDSVQGVVSHDATNEEIFEAMRKQASGYLKECYSVFFDASNLKQKYRQEVINDVGKYAEYIVGVYFPVNVESAKKNNRNRLLEMSDEDIQAMVQSVEKISFSEGFNSIWTVY